MTKDEIAQYVSARLEHRLECRRKMNDEQIRETNINEQIDLLEGILELF